MYQAMQRCRGGGPLVFEVGYHPREKKKKNTHVIIGSFFRPRLCMRVHRLGVQKCAKLGKGCVFGHSDKFWKGHDGQINKDACTNACLGSTFKPEKYVFKVCFESPFTK